METSKPFHKDDHAQAPFVSVEHSCEQSPFKMVRPHSVAASSHRDYEPVMAGHHRTVSCVMHSGEKMDVSSYTAMPAFVPYPSGGPSSQPSASASNEQHGQDAFSLSHVGGMSRSKSWDHATPVAVRPYLAQGGAFVDASGHTVAIQAHGPGSACWTSAGCCCPHLDMSHRKRSASLGLRGPEAMDGPWRAAYAPEAYTHAVRSVEHSTIIWAWFVFISFNK